MATHRISFEDARDLIIAGARHAAFPDIPNLEQLLKTDVPKDRLTGMQETLRRLAQHTQKEAIVGTSPFFTRTVDKIKSDRHLKAAVTLASQDVTALVYSITGFQKPAGSSPPDVPAKEPEGKKPTNGGEKPPRRYTEAQWIRIVYAPQLRRRLFMSNMVTPCLTLKPPVDLKDEERYPHDQEKAEDLLEKMGETDFFGMFDDLQRAVRHFFQCPLLDDAKRLNDSLIDVRRRKLQEKFVAYFPADEKEIPRLLGIPEDIDRMQAIMGSNAITGPLVEAALEAYSKLVAEHLKVTATRPALREPTAASAVEEGTDPRLPRRAPSRPASFGRPDPQNLSTKDQNVNADKTQEPGGTGGQPTNQPVQDPRPDLRVKELETLKLNLAAAKKTAEEKTKEADEAKKALADVTKARDAHFENLRKAEAGLTMSQQEARDLGTDLRNERDRSTRLARQVQELEGQLRDRPAVQNGWSWYRAALLAIFLAALVLGGIWIGGGFDAKPGQTTAPTTQEASSVQQTPANLPPIKSWDEVGPTTEQK